MEHSQRDRADGFLITAQASKNALPNVISSLKADTQSWTQEGELCVKPETYSNRQGGVDEGENFR